MTLYEKVKVAIKQSKTSGLNKTVKFEHNGCVYGVHYTRDHKGDRFLVHRCFLGADVGHSLISTRNFAKAVFEIMIDSHWHRFPEINESINSSRSFRKLNHLYKNREQWIGGKCFMIRDSIEYTWIKSRLPWETKYDIFNSIIKEQIK